MSVIGAALMVLLGVLAPRQALDAIDFPTLVLLFGMMLLAGALEEAGFFEWITEHIIAHVDARHLLPTVIFSGGILSALLVNDVVCVIMTPLVLNVAHRMRRHSLPYLLALGYGFEHRQYGNDCRQPAEHPHRIGLAHQLSEICGAPWTGGVDRLVCRLADAAVAVPQTAERDKSVRRLRETAM